MTIAEAQRERRGGTSTRISHLLNERQQLLILYSRVSGLDPDAKDQPVETLLRSFLQVLVDYVAVAHFELYNHIEEGKERRQAVLQIARKAHPVLTGITQNAVDFNDKYEFLDSEEKKQSLHDDLSLLGEQLAARFELEDQLFRAFLS